MTDSKIIWRFLNSELTNDHPAVYLYACGQKRSQITAVEQALKIVNEIFCPPYTVEFLKTLVKAFLEYKKEEYINNKIQVTPIYR
jgi:DNA-dependent RNA polymerase auxiliary subunit epsilon